MATTATTVDSSNQRPSSSRLEDQAAIAALYVTKHDKKDKNGQAYLDSQNRLSSAGAAASLKYANPEDLPSYPISGLKSSNSAAGAAASLGWANQKSFEHWKPDPSASASAAATAANGYKMKELWQPEQSADGARAALLAHRDGGKVEIWRPEADSPWGNSAATQAFKKFGAGGLSPVLDYGHTAVGRQGSLIAATGAMSESRKRAISTPQPVQKPDTYPDESRAVANALSAANSAHKTQKRTGVTSDSGSTPYTNMSREMYTSHPPVAPEVAEKNHADTLRASAIAMAKGMYNLQQKQFEQLNDSQMAASAAHRRKSSSSTISEEVQPMSFNNLQEAAQKLAQERLAKLHDEHAQNREYRDHYGDYSKAASRLSMRGRARRRASSEGGLDDDKEQSNKIRAQMSMFSNNLSQVDAKKRAADREALIAVAQRNVTKSLHGMDERVFADTGKIAPSLLSGWEVKAHAAAQAKSDARMENHGKVHIGKGVFIDQSEIDAVARGNVQPVLDEITEKAAAEHERQAAIKAEQLETTRKATERKQRDKDTKAIQKKLKQQEKDEEKLRIKEEKENAKAAQRAEKGKSKSSNVGVVGGLTPTGTSAAETDVVGSGGLETAEPRSDVEEEDEEDVEDDAETRAEPIPTTSAPSAPTPIRTSMEDQASLRMREAADAATGGESALAYPTFGSPDGKGKGKMSWLKTKFSRRLSKSGKATSSGDKGKEEKGFVGGAALTGASANNSTTSFREDAAKGKESGVASPTAPLATEASTAAEPASEIVESPATPAAETSATLDPASEIAEPAILPPAAETEEPVFKKDQGPTGVSSRRASEVSALSVDKEHEATGNDALEKHNTKETVEDDEFQEARDNFDEDLAPPPTFPAAKSRSPAREAKFTEVIDD